MNTIKRIILGVFILLILAVAVFFILREAYMLPKKTTSNLSEVIDMKNIDDLRLTIYCMHPNVMRDQPLSVADLINSCELEDDDFAKFVSKTVVNGIELKKHTDLLKEFSNTEVIPVESKSYVSARIHYIFENKKSLKKFDVTMSGGSRGVVVNGVKVEAMIFFINL